MTIRNLTGRIADLPTFTYAKVTRDILVPRRTRHKAVSLCSGKKHYTRRVTQHCIDPKRWAGETRPRWWPAELQFPGDYLKAVMYSRVRSRNATKGASKRKAGPRVRRRKLAEFCKTCESCKVSVRWVDELCACTAAPWDANNTNEWADENIELRWAGDDKGIGTYARRAIKKGTVLGEYVGELTPDVDSDSTYLFNVNNDLDVPVALIDSLRMGNWVRYINHSCDSSTDFERARIGEEIRFIVKATKRIRVGEEVTVNYGDGFWKTLNGKGVWCSCGAESCRFSEAAIRERVKESVSGHN
ncbi:SET domain-containing protein [Stagonosporopsis vannaccii]|nr:SET domain-containing protein [Stagonosporopsis vannaccii]